MALWTIRFGNWRNRLRTFVRGNRRGGYAFQVNPLGTQMDGLIVEEQRDNSDLDFDAGWDWVWSSNARIVGDGWTITIEIPFTTRPENTASFRRKTQCKIFRLECPWNAN